MAVMRYRIMMSMNGHIQHNRQLVVSDNNPPKTKHTEKKSSERFLGLNSRTSNRDLDVECVLCRLLHHGRSTASRFSVVDLENIVFANSRLGHHLHRVDPF